MKPASKLLFMRHGATAPNLAQQRCGGDHDVPLINLGRAQARAAAVRLASAGIGVVVTADLLRTRETAAIVATMLGSLAVIVEPAWRERHLGEWNGQPAETTDLRGTPPGGEANAEFIHRIERALPMLVPLLPRRPLLVASRGVARALGEILGQPAAAPAANTEVIEFDLAAWCARQPAGYTE